jgi:hypothetical protein
MTECAKVEGQGEVFGVLKTECAKVLKRSILFSSTAHAMKVSRI